MNNNLIIDTDSYKMSHFQQYPVGTETVFSYLESRGGEFDKVLFFGIQYILKKYFSKPITLENIEEAKEISNLHGVPFNEEGWLYILNKHNGYLPLKIKAVPEGTIIDKGHVLMTIENTDSNCYWLTNFMETQILRIWYPITVATKSYHIKQLIKEYIDKTSDDYEQIYFKLHDFGSRGVSSDESAGIGGLAHLVNFKGTDTVISLKYAREYYNCKIAGFSIVATEHSTMTAHGEHNEKQAFLQTLDIYKGKMVSVVSDSYDIYNACRNIWGKELKERVINHGNTVVIRPDSGNPITTPVECIEILDESFGHTINSKGYKVLNNVKVIQGDGIDIADVENILKLLESKGYAVDNIAFGMGGGLLQKVNRDTLKMAIKCSAIKINGEWKDVYKKPLGQEDKKSKKGRLYLVRDFSEQRKYETRSEGNIYPQYVVENMLETVYENGKIFINNNLDEIRMKSE